MVILIALFFLFSASSVSFLEIRGARPALSAQNAGASRFSHSHSFPALWWTCWIKLVPALISGGSPIKPHQANGAVCSFTKPNWLFLLPMCSVTLVLTVDFYHLLRSVSHPWVGSSSSHLTPLLFALTGYTPRAADLQVHTWVPTQPSSECHLLTSY